VFDAHSCSEADIKIRFNNLCAQFLANPRYFGTDQSIPEDESISYEMLVNQKRYQAAFFQKGSDEDPYLGAMNRTVWFMINKQYERYSILMYYDNCLNQANGEDL
jgi:hypothetical protein